MPTQKKLEANRRNAQRSMGPRTKKGKERSSLNAMRHGLLSHQIVVNGEVPEEFEQFASGISESLKPVGFFEMQLAERISVCFWRLRRVYRIESGILELAGLNAELARGNREAEKLRNPPTHSEISKYLSLPPSDRQKLDLKTETVSEVQEKIDRRVTSLSTAFKFDSENGDLIGTLSRYEASIERALHKALHELQRMQASPKGNEIPTPIVLDVTGGALD